MTIEQWNIVLNAVIAVGMVGYGIWLKYVVKQQLATKDTAIQALEAAMTSKDAEISRLQGETAPAMAAAYAAMREHANEMAGETQRLTEELRTLQSKLDVHNIMDPAGTLLAEAAGVQVMVDAIGEEFSKFSAPEPAVVSEQTVVDMLSAVSNLRVIGNVQIQKRLQVAERIKNEGKES